jgi:hypothetical protein
MHCRITVERRPERPSDYACPEHDRLILDLPVIKNVVVDHREDGIRRVVVGVRVTR